MLDSSLRSSVSVPSSCTPTSSHRVDTAPKCVCPSAFQIIEVPVRSKCSLERSSISVSNLNIPKQHGIQQRLSSVSAPSSCTPTSSHSMDTAPINLFALWLCKSSAWRQHLNAGKKGSRFICLLWHYSSISLSILNIPKQHVDSNVRSSFSPASSGIPTSSHSMGTPPKFLNVFALRLCKSSTCKQDLNAENKRSKIWTLNRAATSSHQQRPQQRITQQHPHTAASAAPYRVATSSHSSVRSTVSRSKCGPLNHAATSSHSSVRSTVSHSNMLTDSEQRPQHRIAQQHPHTAASAAAYRAATSSHSSVRKQRIAQQPRSSHRTVRSRVSRGHILTQQRQQQRIA